MSSVAQIFDLALKYYQAGHLHQAEVLFRQILQADPRHVNALHILGMIAHQGGRSDVAIDAIQQALRLRPEFPAAYNNLGIALRDRGKLDEAIASYRQALRQKPDFAEAYNNLGVALRDQGKLEEAISNYREALRRKSDYVAAYNNLGVALRDQGKLDEAISNYREALRRKSDYADAHNNLGIALQDKGKLDEAIVHYQQAVRRRPDYAEAHNNLGIALYRQGKLEAAIASYQQVLRIEPELAEVHNNLGTALYGLGRLDEAIASYRRVLALKPGHAEAYSNLGIALRDGGQLDEAVANCQRAVLLKPDYAEGHNNLGMVLQDQGRFDEAIASCRQAERLKPDFVDVYSNLALAHRCKGRLEEAVAACREVLRLQADHADGNAHLATILLLKGDYAQGWKHFEWRWQTRHMKAGVRHFSQPRWQGESLPQGTILLYAEQGLGDTIQFVRFAALVKQRVGTVLCECPPELVRLLRSCAGIDRIIPSGEPLPPFDVHAALLSLPGILNTTLDTIPASIPYLDAGGALTEEQGREWVDSEDMKIGIVWQGNPKTWNADLKRSDQRRSIPLARFEPLARVPGVRLVSLQKGSGVEQIQELAGRIAIADVGSRCTDFTDTAAVMKNLDLVISVDSSPAHLAGALGVPVWIPLPSICCWRWLMQREDSPWYPTMRLFRQTTPGEWVDVFERMARELLIVRLPASCESWPGSVLRPR